MYLFDLDSWAFSANILGATLNNCELSKGAGERKEVEFFSNLVDNVINKPPNIILYYLIVKELLLGCYWLRVVMYLYYCCA